MELKLASGNVGSFRERRTNSRDRKLWTSGTVLGPPMLSSTIAVPPSFCVLRFGMLIAVASDRNGACRFAEKKEEVSFGDSLLCGMLRRRATGIRGRDMAIARWHLMLVRANAVYQYNCWRVIKRQSIAGLQLRLVRRTGDTEADGNAHSNS